AAWALLGERPSARFVSVLPIVLTGVVLISGVFESDAYGVDPVRGVIFGLGTSVAYAIALLLLRAGTGESRRGSAALLDFTLTAALVSAALGPVSGGFDPVPSWPAHGWLILLALVAQVLGWLLISYALPRLRAAMTALLLLIQPVGAMLLAALVLAEQPSALQLAGCGLVLGGVLLAAQRRAEARKAGAEVVAATPNEATSTAGVVAVRAD
ncbi:MAG TPA: DMT family transporter, partial [Actinomycetes bacterium]|nr:DMT family transporter [Actinomycetes bacterium]